MDFITLLILTIVILFFVVFVSVLLKSVYLVKQAETIIIERFGVYDRTLGPGLHIIIPFVESPRNVTWSEVYLAGDKRYYRKTRTFYTIDLRETVNDFPKQNVITKDNVNMEINALLYYQITDPKSAIYEVSNVPEAIEKLTQTTLRNVIGSMDLDETLSSRDAVNEKLRVILDEATDKWGVKVNRVELQEVNPPADIRHAMEKQMRAERDRRAIIIESDGKKQAAILQAQGEQESSVLRAQGLSQSKQIEAQGEAQARIVIAQAEAQAIDLVKKASGQDALAYLATMQYVKALPKIVEGDKTKLVIVPYQSAGLAGSISTIKELLAQSGLDK
jgi:regulator of protease activity HflC (stomatin/prohibitin superfamily)